VTAVETLAIRIRGDMRRVATAIGALRGDLAPDRGEDLTASSLVGARLGLLLGRRLEEVEGAVAVATALAERSGVELREELHAATEALANELESVARLARTAIVESSSVLDGHMLEPRFDEVHRRIDAVTRELRAELAELRSPTTRLPSPYGERLAETLGRRLQRLEGAVAVATTMVERTGAEVRDELADVAAAGEFRRRALADELTAVSERLEAIEQREPGDPIDLAALRVELRALEVRLGDELAALRAEIESRAARKPALDLALEELAARLRVAEGDRDAITAQLVQFADSWAAERSMLHERVAELAARIVTGPVPAAAEGDEAVWPTGPAFEQLRISVEGLRMRLAYHEKAVAELVRGRDADDRIEDMERLLRRLESAGATMPEAGDVVLERLERVAAEMDRRLEQLAGYESGD